MKQGKWHDSRGYPNDAHRGMLDVDEMFVKRNHVIIVDPYTAILIQKGKTVFVSGAEKKNVDIVDARPVFQTNCIFIHTFDTRNLYHVRW